MENSKIIKVCRADVTAFRKMAEEYHSQIDDGIINPAMVDELFISRMPGNNEWVLFLKSDEGIFRGVLEYILIPASNSNRQLSNYFSGTHFPGRDLRISDLIHIPREDSGKSIAKITGIETFPQANGYGRALIESIKQDQDLTGIMLWPIHDAIGFYEQMGFGRSNVFVDSIPLMAYQARWANLQNKN